MSLAEPFLEAMRKTIERRGPRRDRIHTKEIYVRISPEQLAFLKERAGFGGSMAKVIRAAIDSMRLEGISK